MDSKEYLTTRLDNQISYFSKKSRANRLRFTSLSTTQIALAAMLPVIVNVKLPFLSPTLQNALVSSIGVIIVISTGLLNLNKYQEKWISYRKTAEKLKQERYIFLSQSTELQLATFTDFVEKIEDILSSENEEWSNRTATRPAEVHS